MKFFEHLLVMEGENYGIIVEKKRTQKILRAAGSGAAAAWIERGKGFRTAGPVERREVLEIVRCLGCGAEAACVREMRALVAADACEEYRVVYLPKLREAKELETRDWGTDCAFVVRLAVNLDPTRVSFHDALVALLPPGTTVPGAFETVGHVAHLNLLPCHEPYKEKIGQLMLQKMPAIKTVVNKKHELQSEFRACPFELLAGEPNYITVHIEHGLKFYIDYEHVFWNSRLSGERFRLTSHIQKGSDIYDVMGGVGSFGVYLAKFNNCHVVTNDLNPDAHTCATKNIALNKVSNLMRSCNMDAREFIKTLINPKFGSSCLQMQIKFHDVGSSTPLDSEETDESAAPSFHEPLTKRRRNDEDSTAAVAESEQTPKVYFLMNLPKIAVNFLDAFVGVCNRPIIGDIRDTRVLVYCFASPDNFETAIKDRIKSVVGEDAFQHCEIMGMTLVRNVSPSKNQYCVEIKLTLPLIRYRHE